METDTTGGYDNRVSSARPRTCHSICVTARAVKHPSRVARIRDYCSCFPHSSLSPPFHHANRVSNHDRTCAVDRAAIKRPKTRADLVTGGRTPRLSRTDAVRVWGSPWVWREPPENWVVGCETRETNEGVTHAISLQTTAVNTYTLQDLLHFHNEP